jgi:GNAT superfamily N-acetyltransferase
MLTVEFLDDPAALLETADDYLRADPVGVNILTVYAQRAATTGVPETPVHWYAVVRDDDTIVGVAMRNAPFAPHPMWLSAMPDEAARAVAAALVDRGEHPGGANGALPPARIVAEECARHFGGTVEVAMGTRLWELGTLRPPTRVPGRARLATYDDLTLCHEWYADFPRAAREQAGNSESAQGDYQPSKEETVQRIEQERILLWEVDRAPVHLTGMAYPVLGVGRIAPVYTPDEHRGRGYAAAGVAAASARLQALGRVCLFTDLDNRVSNHLYATLGYEPVVDMANHTIVETPA